MRLVPTKIKAEYVRRDSGVAPLERWIGVNASETSDAPGDRLLFPRGVWRDVRGTGRIGESLPVRTGARVHRVTECYTRGDDGLSRPRCTAGCARLVIARWDPLGLDDGAVTDTSLGRDALNGLSNVPCSPFAIINRHSAVDCI